MEFVDYKCLESLLIEGEEIAVTEGFTDKIKSAAEFIGKGLMAILRAIRKILGIIVDKVRDLLSRKGSKESPKETADRLAKENEKLKAKLSKLESDLNSEKTQNNYLTNKSKTLEDEKDKASKMIASLKKQIADNEANEKAAKDAEKMQSKYNDFQKTAMTFIALVSQQCNKAYTLLPNLIEKAKKFNRMDVDKYVDTSSKTDREFSRDITYNLPGMHGGSWGSLYTKLKYNYLEEIQKNSKYLYFTDNLGLGFKLLVKEATKTIEYLENMVNEMNKNGAKNNPAYREIIEGIMMKEGFIDMLHTSINISNSILSCYTMHDKHIYEDKTQAI